MHKGKALTEGKMRELFTTAHGSSAVSLVLSATAVPKTPAPPGLLPRAESKNSRAHHSICANLQQTNTIISCEHTL